MSDFPPVVVISGSPQLLTRSSHSLYQYVLFTVTETVGSGGARGAGAPGGRRVAGGATTSATPTARRRWGWRRGGRGSGGVGADGCGGHRGPELATGVEVEGVYGGGGYLGGDGGG